jgi:CubicO group peptidase (beta-lactamase class C family)
MQDYRHTDGRYITGSASVHPAYAFDMSARDLARFALLYLRNGSWEGREIVPAHWMDESTRSYSKADYAPGYGYMWRVGFNNALAPAVSTPPECHLLLMMMTAISRSRSESE